MQTLVPAQHSNTGLLVKKFLHTKIGAHIGYIFGLKGFNRLDVILNGKPVSRSFNSRVNKGADLIASLITGSAQNSISSPLPPKYVALSTSSLTPAAGDTTLSGETAGSGLARALGTQGSYTGPASLDGSASYTVTKTFTSGTSATIQSAALFDAVSTGNMFVEANLSASVTVNSGDTLAITWTVNL